MSAPPRIAPSTHFRGMSLEPAIGGNITSRDQRPSCRGTKTITRGQLHNARRADARGDAGDAVCLPVVSVSKASQRIKCLKLKLRWVPYSFPLRPKGAEACISQVALTPAVATATVYVTAKLFDGIAKFVKEVCLSTRHNIGWPFVRNDITPLP